MILHAAAAEIGTYADVLPDVEPVRSSQKTELLVSSEGREGLKPGSANYWILRTREIARFLQPGRARHVPLARLFTMPDPIPSK